MRYLIDSLKLMYRDISTLGSDYFILRFLSIRESHNWNRLFRIVFWIFISILSIFTIPNILKLAYSATWTGFGKITTINGQIQPQKSLWDWMELLLIPLVLAITAYWFTRTERRNELRIALEKQQEDALREYLDQMANLLLNTDLDYELKGSLVVGVARARTLAVISSLDGHRKGILLRFLYEVGLISNEDPLLDMSRTDLTNLVFQASTLDRINLRGANLDRANLQRMNLANSTFSSTSMRNVDLRYAYLVETYLEYTLLDNSNLSMANLSGARLGKAQLYKANLSYSKLESLFAPKANFKNVNLRKANLHGAVLDGCDFIGANLKNADLSNASLIEVNLSKANLKRVNLEGANLTRAIITKRQLRQAKSIDGAILDDAQERLGSPVID